MIKTFPIGGIEASRALIAIFNSSFLLTTLEVVELLKILSYIGFE